MPTNLRIAAVIKHAASRSVRLILLVLATAAAAVAVAAGLGYGVSVRLAGLYVVARDPVRPAAVSLVALAAFIAGTVIARRHSDDAMRPGVHPWAISLATILGIGPTIIVVAAFVALFPDAYPTGDGASLSLYTIAATHGSAYVGPYSQFGWNHPGPMLFYVMAPLYALSGYHEMSVRLTALLINTACLSLMLVIARRFAGRVFSVLTVAGIFLLEYRASGDLPFSPWNPHVTLLPLAALVFVTAAISVGAMRLLPLAAVLTTFVAQSHIGFVPVSTFLFVAAVALGARATDGASLRRQVNRAAWLTALLWFPPLAEQFINRPGNFTKLGQYLLQQSTDTKPFTDTLQLFSSYYVVPLSRHVSLPVGWPAAVPASPLPVLASVLLMSGGVWSSLAGIRTGNRFIGMFCGLCVTTSVVALASISHIGGTISDHHVFWVSVLGMLTLIGTCAHAIQSRRAKTHSIDVAVYPAVWVFMTLLFLAAFSQMWQWQRTASTRRSPLVFYQAIDEYMLAGGYKTARVRHTEHSWSQVVGIVLQGAKRRRHLVVSPDMAHVVGDDYSLSGRQDVDFMVLDQARDRISAPPSGQLREICHAEGLVLIAFEPNTRKD